MEKINVTFIESGAATGPKKRIIGNIKFKPQICHILDLQVGAITDY